MGSGEGGCCRCCFSFIFTLGLTALFLWLSLRGSKPSLSVREFYIPTLNESLAPTTNTTVFMTLRLDNGNKDKGINYDNVNLTLWYVPNASDPLRSRVRINDSVVPAFYQGHKKKANKPVNFTASGFNWSDVRPRVFNDDGARAVFRVDVVTKVRFKIIAWRTKRHTVTVGGNVEVNHLGQQVNKEGKFNKKGTKLNSANRNGSLGLRFGVFSSFVIWVLMGF